MDVEGELSITGDRTGFFGLKLSRMSGWRHVQERAGNCSDNKMEKVRVIGLDVCYFKGMGVTQPVIVAVGMGDRFPITIGCVD
jgi:hypothetical protein